MHDLSVLIAALSAARVLVVGDVMLDTFVTGDVTRISPESPVPVLSITRKNRMLGGAGNVLSNLAGLGVRSASMIAIVGADAEGDEVRALAAGFGGRESDILTDTNRPTTLKTRFLAGNHQLLRTDYEKTGPVSEDLEKKIIERVEAYTKDDKIAPGAIILSDYGKGILTSDIIRRIIELAGKKKIPVLVDPKGSDYSRYKGASAVTPNRAELALACGNAPTGSDLDIENAARKIIKDSGVEAVIATRSRDGMSVIRKDKKETTHIRTEAVEVFDVSGAGDTVIAVIGAALATGANLEDAAALATVAGSIVVTKVGTAPIRVEELSEAVVAHDPGKSGVDRTREARVCTSFEALEDVRRWRARGLKIGFTNGCFDILHRGHVLYLNEARSRCDRLVVGLNTDASVKLLKGPSRPVNDQDARAAVIGALGSVDLVVFFGAEHEDNDNTASALINALQPDIYFKGGDYSEEQIPEALVVRAHGGSVDILPFHENHSTTSIIRKVKGEAA